MNLELAFKSLTPNQFLASTSDTNKSLIILAGPGSGKTLTLTLRIAFLLNSGIPPKQILVSTFTRKAADEMRKRLNNILPAHLDSESLTLGTFHHCALNILRANANKAGLPFDFRILSTSKQKKVLTEVLQDFLQANDFTKLVIKGVKPLSEEQLTGILEDVEREDKGNKLPAGCLSYVYSVICKAKIDRKCLKLLNRPFFGVFEEYNRKLRDQKGIDMSDILFLVVNVLEKYPDVLSTYQNRFKYVIVDEFQDTNSIQLEFLKLIGKSSFVTVCGDDDQAIYAWRGATSEVFSEFRSFFPECQTVVLDQNFRSSGEIVEKCGKLIMNNVNREVKNIRTGNAFGCAVEVIIAENTRKEMTYIRNFIRKSGGEFKEIAVLYRLNRVGNEFLNDFSQNEIPVKSRKKQVSLEKTEINLVSYLKVISNPSDDQSFLSIFNWPKRSLGDSSKVRLKNTASCRNLTLYQSLEHIVKQHLGKNQKAFLDLYTILSYCIQNLSKLNAFQILQKIISRYDLPACHTLLQLSEPFKSLGAESLNDFIDSVSLSEDPNSVTLSTIHQSKGQEWETVFIVRLNEGVLPCTEDIEEERRLAYVAATRARSRLILTCSMASQNGENIVPSRFIDEFFADLGKKNSFVLTPSKELKITRY